jgi:tetratricopeptide (TPR) repeat protein
LGKKIQSEKGLDKKFEIAKKLLEKYPKSSLRVQFVDYLLNEIVNLTDPEQRIAALENSFLSTFTDAAEQNKAVPFLVESYQAAKRWDDAFSYAPKAFEVDPGNVILFTQLAIGGADLARQGKKDYLDQTKDYAGKAIALIEADKKPASLADGFWADFKKQWLPQLYQSKGILALTSGSPTEAKTHLQKAITLSPADPYNHFMLGTIVNEDYQKQAKLFNIMPAGAEKDAQLKVIQARMDEIIDHYAHAVALASLNPQYKNLHDQVLQDLQAYYKFRKGSLDGLQALIDKYKTKPIGG